MKTSLANAFAVVCLFKIQEFHLLLKNTAAALVLAPKNKKEGEESLPDAPDYPY